MNIFQRIIAVLVLVILPGCGTHVFVAGFNEKSEGDIFPNSDNYSPPENPSGDLILGDFLTVDTHRFTDNLAMSYDTALLITPITPSGSENSTLRFRSKNVSNSHNKFTLAWSGRKKGNEVLNCVFGTEKSTQTALIEKDVFTLRFGGGKLFAWSHFGSPVEVGTLSNDVEHRVFVTVRENSSSYYAQISSSSPQLTYTGTFGSAEYQDFDKIRVKCQYGGTASAGSNHYVFDKMEFKTRKN